MSRKVLGRGLDALIPQPDSTSPRSDSDRIHSISVDQIHPNPRQPRRDFTEDRLAELARSIQEKGILEPLILRIVGNEYELVAGERRLRAARLAGLTEVPAILRDYEGRESLEVALIENLQREDLNPVEEARAYQRLSDEFGRTHAEISREVGKDRSTVTNLLRILRLPDVILEQVSRETLSVGHARVLLSLSSPQDQINLATRMVDEGWSVREAERHTARIEKGKKSRGKKQQDTFDTRDREVVRVEEALRYALGTEVHLTHGPAGGRIEIRYTQQEELERILDLLGIQIH